MEMIIERCGADFAEFAEEKDALFWIDTRECCIAEFMRTYGNAIALETVKDFWCTCVVRDNSAMESFFGRMKNEMFYGRDWSGGHDRGIRRPHRRVYRALQYQAHQALAGRDEPDGLQEKPRPRCLGLKVRKNGTNPPLY